jgi:hypothetical protein
MFYLYEYMTYLYNQIVLYSATTKTDFYMVVTLSVMIITYILFSINCTLLDYINLYFTNVLLELYKSIWLYNILHYTHI